MAVADTKFPLSFARCSNCHRIGAEIELPSDRYACGASCEALLVAGGRAGDLPPTVTSEKSVSEVLSQCREGLRPADIAAAVIWLAMKPEDVSARVAGLYTLVERYRRENPGPYSKTPLPMEPALFNLAMSFASSYAQKALDKIVDSGAISQDDERLRLETLVQNTNPHQESDVEAHAETLFLIYVLMFRPWLAWWDHCRWCALSDADIDALPKAPVTREGKDVVGRDMREALLVLADLMTHTVNDLYHRVGMTKASIKRFLIEGLFAQAKAHERDVTPVTGMPGPTTTEELVNVNVVSAIMSIDMRDADHAAAEFLAKVENVNAGVFDWIKSRARKTYSRVRGLGSTRQYSWISIAEDLYKVYLANVCDGGIARSQSIAVPSIISLPQGSPSLQPRELFSAAYAAAYGALEGTIPSWKGEFDQMVALASRQVSSRDSREKRIQSYTCAKSSAARIQISMYREFPARIAVQVKAMGTYFYSDDPKKPGSNEKRRQAVQKDVKQLVIELRRKVGDDAAAILLQAISPIIPGQSTEAI